MDSPRKVAIYSALFVVVAVGALVGFASGSAVQGIIAGALMGLVVLAASPWRNW